MIVNYFRNISNNEKIYLLIVVVLIIALVLMFIKFKKHSKKVVTEIDDKPKVIPVTEVDKINVPKEPFNEETNPSKMQLDDVLEQMRKDLEEQKPIDQVKTFEEEQEEKSIISYQELLHVNNKEITETKIEEKEEIKKEVINEKEPSISTTTFRNSEFISPIYGRVNNDIEYPTIPKIRRAKLGNDELEPTKQLEEEPIVEIIEEIEEPKFEKNPTITELEKTLNTAKLQKKLSKNEDFLKTLREFRKKLD